MAKYKLSDLFEGNYKISQDFGANPAYYAQWGLAGHEGTDFATPIGVNVLAPFDGFILQDQDNPRSGEYGEYVVIWDPVQKCAVWYCHLDSNFVSLGQKVTKGQIVGKTGNSGNTTGPHLHVNFVITDAYGNRLNTNNGFGGNIDLMKNVQFVLSGTPLIPLTDGQKIVKITDLLLQPISGDNFRDQVKNLLK